MPTTADAAMYTIGCSFFVGLTTFVSTQMTAASSSPFQKNRSANRPLARKALSCRSEMRTTGKARRRDQRSRCRTQPIKRMVDKAVFPELFQARGNDEDADDRGGHEAQRRNERAGNAGRDVAHIRRRVDADRAGRGLRHRDHVRDLLIGEPAVRSDMS